MHPSFSSFNFIVINTVYILIFTLFSSSAQLIRFYFTFTKYYFLCFLLNQVVKYSKVFLFILFFLNQVVEY